jgi:hypothetical protein
MAALQNNHKDLGEKDPRFTDTTEQIEDHSSNGDDDAVDWTPAEERKLV